MKKNLFITIFFTVIVSLFQGNTLLSQNNSIVLNGAVTVMNGGTATTPVYIVVNQNSPSGIVRNSGHIHSENQYNFIKWEAGTTTGNYVIPFGIGGNLSDYIPFTFNKTTAGSSNVMMSTWTTDIPNFPRPSATNVGAVTNMIGFADSVLYAIDRFWDIQTSTATTADLTFSYRGIENTTVSPTNSVRAQHWSGTSWDNPVIPGNIGVTTGVGTAGPFVNQNTFSPWVLTIEPTCPEDTISYSNNTVCNNISTLQSVSHTNSSMVGIFSASPIGLSIDTITGDVNPSLSTPGLYTVTYTVDSTMFCPQYITTTTITILQMDDASFSYSGASFCLTGTDPVATVLGTLGGVFTMSGVGVIDTLTGVIDLSASGLGTFTVYYNTTLAGNSCPQLDSAIIDIVNTPGASFTYNTPFCEGNTNPSPTFVGNNFAGTFSSSINTTDSVIFVNTSTGEIDLSLTTAGTYMIYNNLVASGGCAAALDSFEITINPSYNIQETVAVCNGGSYTFPDGTTQTNIVVPITHNSNLTTGLGCDSIVETTVNINPIPFTQVTGAVCNGGSYTFPDGTTQININTQVVYNSTLVSALGCDSIIETTVNINPQLSATPDATTPICIGDPIVLTATSSGNGVITWYSDAAGTIVIGIGSPCTPAPTVTAPGLYTYYVNEVGTCSSTIVSVNQLVGGVTASIGATPSSGFLPLDVVFSSAGSSTGANVVYTWNFGDGTPTSNLSSPSHTYTSLGSYVATLTVSDNGSCPITVSITIEVIGQSSILIPNVFTPNSDGSNDVFTVDGTNLESVEGEIFNRWGLSLFSWNAFKGSWNGRTTSGTECPDGTYFYIIKAKGMDGVDYFKKGAFSLIR